MSLTTPTNCLTHAENRFATALAGSAAFQSLVGAADFAGAAPYVFGERLGEPIDGEAFTADELAELRHFAQVFTLGYGKSRQGSSRFEPYGQVSVYMASRLADMDASEELPAELTRRWNNTVGSVMDQVAMYLEEESGPYVMSYELVEPTGTNDRHQWAKDGVWQLAEFSFTWGING